MISKLHERLGTAGLVVSIVALVAALTGTAIAAGGLTKQQEKQVTKIAKKHAGKKGPTGPQGLPGAAGPAGAPGAAGKDGAQGERGVTGAKGATGATGPSCPVGHCFLPSKATETGTFTFNLDAAGEYASAVSFNLPLKAALDEAHRKFINIGDSIPAECDDGTGTASSAANPEADPGYLCIYLGFVNNGDGEIVFAGDPSNPVNGAGKTGAFAVVASTEASSGAGTFAVTAP